MIKTRGKKENNRPKGKKERKGERNKTREGGRGGRKKGSQKQRERERKERKEDTNKKKNGRNGDTNEREREREREEGGRESSVNYFLMSDTLEASRGRPARLLCSRSLKKRLERSPRLSKVAEQPRKLPLSSSCPRLCSRSVCSRGVSI